MRAALAVAPALFSSVLSFFCRVSVVVRITEYSPRSTDRGAAPSLFHTFIRFWLQPHSWPTRRDDNDGYRTIRDSRVENPLRSCGFSSNALASVPSRFLNQEKGKPSSEQEEPYRFHNSCPGLRSPCLLVHGSGNGRSAICFLGAWRSRSDVELRQCEWVLST